MKLIERKRSRRCTGLLLTLFILVIPMQPVLAKGEDVFTTSGALTSNETWNGRVHITGDVVVPEGITLTVQPGTIITFTPNRSDNDVKTRVLNELWTDKCNLVVKGNLRIEGEKDNKVIVGEFTYDVTRQTSIIWGGIMFEGTNVSSIIKYGDIRYADVALVFIGSSIPRIINSTIAGNDVGIMTFDLSAPRISSNKIHDNTLWGISCYNYSFPMISQNTIRGSDVGVGCEDSSRPIIQYNRFSDNSVDILTQDSSNPARIGNILNTKGIEIERSRRASAVCRP